ncbi:MULTISPECIES: hypothetical protein [unclassified Leisingera]|uniref:hypothetical protein n=1 Tax=unclassified Leisingera TaxID=2614906 RepID=UPI0003100627|nr:MULTISPECIES: hypothetical protein [unclassified Leisingera]KIC22316.1 hypothetical protein RA23_19505 [Leisingera sp. ANG-S3]KIC53499.1 hypothetical protein RA22_09520 [Leisingera sp. ANG-S]KID07894.1 hypothetical protein GC1_17965 [Leisingera sp. ANG1]
MRTAYAACLAVLLAPPAAGGAWLEVPGKGFASASATYRETSRGAQQELSYYGAYGITPKLTLGVDLNQTGDLSGHALVFARLPLREGERYRLAAEAAFGGNHYRGQWQMMQKTTLSYGRGFQTGKTSGWLAVDAAYELRNSGLDAIWKLDATLGLNRPGKPAPMLQIETYKPEGAQFSYTLTPSLRYPLPAGRELILGLEHRSAGGGSLGLKLGLWQKF